MDKFIPNHRTALVLLILLAMVGGGAGGSSHIDYLGDGIVRLEEAQIELASALEHAYRGDPLLAINRTAVAMRKMSNATKAFSNEERFRP